MVDRIMRIIKLDFSVFREIESDPQATTEAAIIVAVTSLLSALASTVGSDYPVAAFTRSLINGFAGWIIWSAVIYFVGKSLFSGGGTLAQMLRVLGYAHVPMILRVLVVIPCVGWLAALAGFVLTVIAAIMAIKEALDVELGTAIAVVVVGAIGMAIFWAIVGVIIGAIFAVGFGLTQLFT